MRVDLKVGARQIPPMYTIRATPGHTHVADEVLGKGSLAR